MTKTSTELRKSSRIKKQAILNVATKLFMEIGYKATSMSAIVERVGGSKGTIYSYFKNKQALFESIVDDTLREHIRPLYDVDITNLDLEEGLTLIAEKGLETITSEKGLEIQRLVFSESKRSPDLGKLYWDHGPSLGYKGLEEYFRKEKKLGNLKCRDPKKAAEYFWGMLLLKMMLERYGNVIKVPGKRKIKTFAREVVRDFLLMCEKI